MFRIDALKNKRDLFCTTKSDVPYTTEPTLWWTVNDARGVPPTLLAPILLGPPAIPEKSPGSAL